MKINPTEVLKKWSVDEAGQLQLPPPQPVGDGRYCRFRKTKTGIKVDFISEAAYNRLYRQEGAAEDV